ncbi:MAG: hypothetical protein K1W06_07625, partial [Lachnospiraceae bacterium]
MTAFTNNAKIYNIYKVKSIPEIITGKSFNLKTYSDISIGAINLASLKTAVYRIARHINRNLGQPEQEFMPDEFAVSEGTEMKGDAQPPETPKAEEPAGKNQTLQGGESTKQ